MGVVIDHRKLYRMPWSLADNAIAWLEPTSKCNITCDGCYRVNRDQHKSLEQVSSELDVFAANRTFDAVSIAGGEPLIHPDIVDIVRMIADRGWKPVINTNGVELTGNLLRDLKQAGLVGLTIHVDSRQSRPGWEGRTELELNELRLHFARLMAEVGGVTCAFNATIDRDNLDHVPDLIRWGQQHIDLVHVMVFILFREITSDDRFEHWVGGSKVDLAPLAYVSQGQDRRSDLTALDVVAKVRERYPDFEPCAYLNGTERPGSFKWLVTSRLGTRRRIYGHIGPKSFELGQIFHHLATGRYFAYSRPAFLRRGKISLGLWPVDRGVRRAFRRFLLDPRAWFRRLYLQSITIIQPIDILPDGRQNMCDGCPDITVHDGELVWSCRLEECIHFGRFVQSVPSTSSTRD